MAVMYLSTARLKRDTTIGSSVDDDLLKPQIVLAQDRHILPVLGTQLDEKLKQLVTNNEIDQEQNVQYKTLLVDYILPALTQFAFVEVAYSLRLRFANNTISLPDTEQGGNASISDIKLVLDRAEDMAMFYRERLIERLRHHTELYPEYQTNTEDDIYPTTRNYFQNLNVYETKVPDNQRRAFLSAINWRP